MIYITLINDYTISSFDNVSAMSTSFGTMTEHEKEMPVITRLFHNIELIKNRFVFYVARSSLID